MSYATHALPTMHPFGVSRSWAERPVRIIAEGLMWLGGGVAFAVTVYVMVALPGLLD